MEHLGIKHRVIDGLYWKFLEQFTGQAIRFIISIILARYLLPEEYGIIAIVTVFIGIAQIFVQAGLGAALIQKKEIDEKDCSSVFYFNILIALIMYGLLCFSAPYVGKFYHDDLIEKVVYVQSLGIIIASLNGVHTALLRRRLQFKVMFVRSVIALLLQGGCGITLARSGFGVWSIVYSQLVYEIVSVLALWTYLRWFPKLYFSFNRMKVLFFYAWKLFLSNLIDTTSQNMFALFLGKVFDRGMLGYYTRGASIPQTLINAIDGPIQQVMFPAFAQKQGNPEHLKKMLRKSIQVSCFITVPAMLGLVVIAKDLTIILLTEKWLESVPFMQMMCIAVAFYPVSTTNLQVISAIGRSDIFLILEIIKYTIILVAAIVSIPYGIYTLIGVMVIASYGSMILNMLPNCYLIGYHFGELLEDLLPSILYSVVMIGVIKVVGIVVNPIILKVVLQVLVGSMTYFGCAFVCHSVILQEVLEVASTFTKRVWKKSFFK